MLVVALDAAARTFRLRRRRGKLERERLDRGDGECRGGERRRYGYDFELSETPTAETTSVTLDNQGEEFHVMIFAKINEGFTLEEAIEAEGEKGTSASRFAPAPI